MRTMNPEATDARISAWRRARLVEAGFPLPLARRLANDPASTCTRSST
jgi:hypothetical protein